MGHPGTVPNLTQAMCHMDLVLSNKDHALRTLMWIDSGFARNAALDPCSPVTVPPMLTNRLLKNVPDNVPATVSRVFQQAEDPRGGEQRLFRDLCARAVLDALGHTGHMEAQPHNVAVSDARNWFKHGNPQEDMQPVDFFDLAGLENYEVVRRAVLEAEPIYMEDEKR